MISMWPTFIDTGAATAKATASAMSFASGSSKPDMKRSRTLGLSPWTWAKMSVATRPGQISVTRTRRPKASSRSWFDSMATAALVAW